MMMRQVNSWNDKIARRLRVARRRLTIRALFRSVLIGLGVGLAAAAASVAMPFSVWWAAAGGTAALLVTFIIQLFRLPVTLDLARRADVKFGLQERVSSSLEIAGRTPAGSLDRLLEQDAARAAENIDPAGLAPLAPGRVPVLAAGIGAALLAISLLLPVGVTLQPLTPTAVEATEPFTASELEETAADLQLLAEETAAEAARLDDQYLAAIARSLEDLGQQLQRGEMSRAEFRQELSRIAEHAELTTAQDTNLMEQLTELAERPPQPDDVIPSPRDDNVALVEESGEAPAPPRMFSQPADSSTDSNGGDGDGPGAGGQEEASADQNPDGESAQRMAMPDEFAGARHYMEPDPEMVARLEERRQQLLAEDADIQGAVPVGASQQSTPGAGDLGGDGAGEMAGAEGPDDVDFGFDSTELELPFDEDATGQRITVEASPDTVLTEIEGDILFSPAHWSRSAESALNQARIGLQQQSAVARYFLPPDQAD